MNSDFGTSTVALSGQQFSQLNDALQSIAIAVGHQPFWQTQIFGVIVGAMIGLLPFLYQIYYDRPIIRVKVDRVWVPSPFPGAASVRSGFSATIYNSGRRAIIIQNVYLRFSDGSSLLFVSEKSFAGGVSGLPKKLEENTSHTVVILAGTIALDLLKRESYPVAVCFSDALGNEFKQRTTPEFWEQLFKSENESEQKDS